MDEDGVPKQEDVEVRTERLTLDITVPEDGIEIADIEEDEDGGGEATTGGAEGSDGGGESGEEGMRRVQSGTDLIAGVGTMTIDMEEEAIGGDVRKVGEKGSVDGGLEGRGGRIISQRVDTEAGRKQ